MLCLVTRRFVDLSIEPADNTAPAAHPNRVVRVFTQNDIVVPKQVRIRLVVSVFGSVWRLQTIGNSRKYGIFRFEEYLDAKAVPEYRSA